MREEWPGLASILAVESIRMVKPHGAVTAEKRFFLSSLPSEDERQIAAIRQHWLIETACMGCWMSRFRKIRSALLWPVSTFPMRCLDQYPGPEFDGVPDGVPFEGYE